MPGAAAPENPASMPSPSAREGSLTGLFALLAVASFFEGFDTMLASLVLPNLGREFGAGPAELGRVDGRRRSGHGQKYGARATATPARSMRTSP